MFHVRDITGGCCEMPPNAAKKNAAMAFPGQNAIKISADVFEC